MAPYLAGQDQAYENSLKAEMNVKVANYTHECYDPDSLLQFRMMQPEDLTPDVLKAGAIFSKSIARRLGVSYTSDYAQLVKRLHASSPQAIEHIHGSFISDLMATEYVLSLPHATDLKGKIKDIFDTKHFVPGPLFAYTALLLAPQAIPQGALRDTCLDDAVLRSIVLKRPEVGRFLCPPVLQHHQLLEQMIAEGFNPPGLSGNTMLSIRISHEMSLKDKLISLSKCKDDEHFELACARGFIKRSPLEDVVAKANTKILKEILIRLYTREELLPHIKHDHVIKGRLLEDELGL